MEGWEGVTDRDGLMKRQETEERDVTWERGKSWGRGSEEGEMGVRERNGKVKEFQGRRRVDNDGKKQRKGDRVSRKGEENKGRVRDKGTKGRMEKESA